MNEQPDYQPNRPSLPTTLYPLRKRTREPKVEKQGQEILTATRSEALRRLKIVNVADPDALLDETLVAIIRHYAKLEYKAKFIRDYLEAAQTTLVARAEQTVARRAQLWKQLTRDERENLARDAAVKLLEEVLKAETPDEFFEIRFARSFRFLYINVSRHYERFTKAEEESILSSSAAGDELDYDRIEAAPDLSLLNIEDQIFVEQALSVLKPEERTAFYLTHYIGLDQKMIAEYLGVTTRTIRNYLDTAKGKLGQLAH